MNSCRHTETRRLIYPSEGTAINEYSKCFKFADRDEIVDEFVLPISEKIVNSHLEVNTSGVSVTRILALKFWIRPIALNPSQFSNQIQEYNRDNQDEDEQFHE